MRSVTLQRGRPAMDDTPATLPKIVFSSDQLPPDLDDRARFLQWRELYTSLYGGTEITRIEDIPFRARSEFMQVGDIGLLQFEGTFGRNVRTSRQAAADPRGDFHVGLLRGRSRIAVSQSGRQMVYAPGQMTLYSAAEAFESRADGASVLVGLCIPRASLLERVANAEDLLVKPLDATRPAARHLGQYVDFLLGCEGIADDPQLVAHINATLLDLVALSLSATGDAAAIAQMRGLRTARLRQVIAEIASGFSDPAFSPGTVARKLGVTPRYLQKLLHETGASFGERVLELRLQSARGMLANRQNDHLKVSDIAGRSGFNDISHFNHCFRRRFGASPTEYRRGQ